MTDMEQRILDLIAKKGVLDRKKYESDSTYRRICDVLANAIEKQWAKIDEHFRGEDRLESFVAFALTSWSEVGKELSIAQAMKDAESAYMARCYAESLSDSSTWRVAERIYRHVRVHRHAIRSRRLSKLVRPLESFTRGRTLTLLAAYTVGLALAMPLLAALVAAVAVWVPVEGTSELASERQDFIALLFALVVVYPLDLVNRRVKTLRKPRLHPRSLPLLIVVAAGAFLEYQYSLLALFQWKNGPSWPQAEVFWSVMKRSATQRWLFLAPFVAIALTLLSRGAFIRFSKEIADIVNELSESPIMSAIIALISAALAVILRLLLSLLS